MISIITPLFNRVDLVKETWGSIHNQTYSDWEWIVVDDGSTDGSLGLLHEIAKSDQRVRVFSRPSELKKGPSSCRNYGVSKSRGDHLIFLDSDDLLASFCLKDRVKVMKANPLLDFAIFPMETFYRGPGDGKLFNLYFENQIDYLKSFMEDRPPWTVTNPIWKKSSFEKLTGFKENYLCMEDPELHIRALLQGLKFEVVKGVTDCYYRNSFEENQLLYDFWEKSIKGRILFLKELYERIETKDYGVGINDKELFKSLRKFYLKLIKGFLLSRLRSFNDDFQEIYKWAEDRSIMNPYQKQIIHLASILYRSESKVLDFVPARGVIYHLI